MGDASSAPIRLSFNPQLRIEFRGATVTSDAGLLLPRELDERLGVSALIEQDLTDPRTGRNSQFRLRDLLRQSIYCRLAGYEDTNDAEPLAEDPTFASRVIVSGRMRCGCCSELSPTTSATCYAGSFSPSSSTTGRSRAFNSGSSRPAVG